ncbi:MAG: hypothetical protein ABI898_08895 [Sphingomonadales bacterium]
MSVVTTVGAWFALLVILAIGVQLLFQRERRRGDDRGNREPLMQYEDPATLRRVRPTTKRLTGTALVVSALIIVGAMGTPLFGLG